MSGPPVAPGGTDEVGDGGRRGPFARFGHGPGGSLTTRQRVVPLGALVLVLVCIVYSLLPFDVVGGAVDCRPALLGSEPSGERRPAVIVGNDEQACRDAGNSRLALAGVIGLASLVIGVAGLVLPPDPEDA